MIAAVPLISSALSMLGSAGAATSAATNAAQAAPGSDFGAMMTKLSKDAVDTVKHAETMSVDGLTGKANLQDVVQSVMSAQESLQTALAIRDKAVAAFQEVSRMSI